MQFLKELWAFLRARKKLWLLPMILVMVIIAAVFSVAIAPVAAPLLYTLF